MKSPIFHLILPLLAAILAACSTLIPTPTADLPTTGPGFPLTPAVTPDPPTGSPGSPLSPEDLAGFPPGTILVQQDYEPGFTRPENHFIFGRFPPFTLYADGTLIYLEEGDLEAEQRVMQVSLSPAETLALVEAVMAAGFERLESYTDYCMPQGGDSQMCVADASTSILRVRLPGGELREVKNYHDFANDPEALREIRALLYDFSHPAAQPFEPAGATLFLTLLDQPMGVTVQDWPLDREWLASVDSGEGEMGAVSLLGENLAAYLAIVPHNIGDASFVLGEKTIGAYLVPWLPGVDFTEEIQTAFPDLADLPAGAASRFQACEKIEPSPLGTLRLAWIEAGDLWIWDRGAGEPYSLTGSGDVTGLRFTADGGTVVYLRQTASGSTLWAAEADGRNMRLLTESQELPGQIELHSFTSDERLLAFTHLQSQGTGELWVANLDGSGARRLVSQDDLMAIVDEPLADFAMPTGVSWIPNTFQLIFDAFPGFEEDGIYIYVQRQVSVSDALSGAQAVYLPPGEGGQVAYSPNGTTMTIATPESLKLMNIEGRDLQEAGFDFYAVGFGEYYEFPPMAWTADSQTLLVAQPADEAYNQDSLVTVWSVPVDGSAPARLAEFSGFFPSFAFSPDRTRIAYWRAIGPQSNTRELHIAALDGSQHVVYETADLLDIVEWAPDSQTLVYTSGEWPGNVELANICEDPVPLNLDFYPVNLSWIHPTQFLFERRDEGVFQLYLGSAESPQEPELLLNLEQFGGYEVVVLPPEP